MAIQNDTAEVYFAVWTLSAEPSEISRLIGIEPSVFYPLGSLVGRSSARRKKSMWKLESGLPRSTPLEDQFEALAKKLLSSAERVREVAQKYECSINCAAYWHTVNPGFSFSAPLVNSLAALNVPIDFDLYCLGESDQSENLQPNSG